MIGTVIALSVGFAVGVVVGVGLCEYDVLTIKDMKNSTSWLIEKGRQARQQANKQPQTAQTN